MTEFCTLYLEALGHLPQLLTPWNEPVWDLVFLGEPPVLPSLCLCPLSATRNLSFLVHSVGGRVWRSTVHMMYVTQRYNIHTCANRPLLNIHFITGDGYFFHEHSMSFWRPPCGCSSCEIFQMFRFQTAGIFLSCAVSHHIPSIHPSTHTQPKSSLTFETLPPLQSSSHIPAGLVCCAAFLWKSELFLFLKQCREYSTLEWGNCM